MAWYDGAIFYQILPGAVLSTLSGDENSNIKELEEYLPYLKVLGCDGIILGPVFSKNPLQYGTGDFHQIREWLGTEEEFRNFVEDALFWMWHSPSVTEVFLPSKTCRKREKPLRIVIGFWI